MLGGLEDVTDIVTDIVAGTCRQRGWTGRAHDAARALELNLVTEVVADEALADHALALTLPSFPSAATAPGCLADAQPSRIPRAIVDQGCE